MLVVLVSQSVDFSCLERVVVPGLVLEIVLLSWITWEVFASVSTYAMSAVFSTVSVIVVIFSAAVADTSSAIGSKSSLSLGDSVLFVRTFFFGIGASSIDLFLLFSLSVLASELSSSS